MKNTNQKGIVSLFIILAALAILGGYFYIKATKPELINKIPLPFTKQPPTTQTKPYEQAQISISEDGFVPGTITIKAGTQVTWTNTDKSSHQVASDPHPIHSGLADLESPALLTNDSYSFVFEEVGSFTYHDHLNPLKFRGTVVVE